MRLTAAYRPPWAGHHSAQQDEADHNDAVNLAWRRSSIRRCGHLPAAKALKRARKASA